MDFFKILERTVKFNTKRSASDGPLNVENRPSSPHRPATIIPETTSAKKRKCKKKAKYSLNERPASVFDPIASETAESVEAAVSTSAMPNRQLNQIEEKINAIRGANRIRVKGSNVPAPITTWDELNFPLYLAKNVTRQWETPTSIQMQAIPVLTAGRELLAVSPTGSGKTAAFLIPILTQLGSAQSGGFRAIILSPTTELAQQTYRRLALLSSGSGLGVFLLSKNNTTTISVGRRDILISTPNRIADLVKNGKLNCDNVEFLIFDEGDSLWDSNGFIDDVDEILAACTNKRISRALFSATMPEAIETLARTILRDPIRVAVGDNNNSACENIRQRLVFAGTEAGKLIAVRNLFVEGLRTPVLIFVQTKSRARQLFKTIKREFPRVAFIESDQSKQERDEVVKRFRAGDVYALITTEVLARGIDFLGVNCVINYDFPQTVSSYIHRIGRTGRAGRSGDAITLFTDEDSALLRSIAGVLKRSGCEDIPKWMLSRRRPNRSRIQELKTRPPKRKRIGAT